MKLIKTDKKAVELPINVIIIAGLALMVFIVLITVFSSESRDFSKSLSCEAKGGKCLKSQDCQYDKIDIRCPNKDEVCCINILGEVK